MLELVGLLLLIAVAFVWFFMAGLTERKTGRKNILAWPFILTYWYGLGRPKTVTKTKTEKIDPEEITKNIKELNASILMLIQKLEVQTNTQKAKQEIVAKEVAIPFK